jgi:hypothetical protein
MSSPIASPSISASNGMSAFNWYIDRQTEIAQAQADIFYLVRFIDDCIQSIAMGYKKMEDGLNSKNPVYLHAKEAIILENMEHPETDKTREAAEILVDNMINIIYENPNWDSLMEKVEESNRNSRSKWSIIRKRLECMRSVGYHPGNGTKCFDWDECITAFSTFRICAEKFLLHETAYKEVPRNTREALLQCCIILLDEKNIFRNRKY